MKITKTGIISLIQWIWIFCGYLEKVRSLRLRREACTPPYGVNVVVVARRNVLGMRVWADHTIESYFLSPVFNG